MSLKIETNERAYLTRGAEEFVDALFTTTHFDYSNVMVQGRLVDLPEAWELIGVKYNHEEKEVTMIFGMAREEEIEGLNKRTNQ